MLFLKMKSKKGQIGGLQGFVMTLIIVGVVLSAGFFIMQEFFEQEEFYDTVGTVVHETGLNLSPAASTVATASTPGFNTFSVSACQCNVTGASVGEYCEANQTIVAANYTADAETGIIINASTTGYDLVACNYTYLYGESGYVGVNDTLDAMTTIPNLLPLIILIMIVGIILAVIFTAIPGSRLGA